MIPVVPQPEPKPPEFDFEEKVRKKGQTFLARTPKPTTKQFNRHAYWQGECLECLYEAYGQTCAYAALWIPEGTGTPTVDHFKPKMKFPHLAYEWTNFRLASQRWNGIKRDWEDVLDPFEIEYGWFLLNFFTLRVFPNEELPTDTKSKVARTIERLNLNKPKFRKIRASWLKRYCNGLPFELFRKDAPFIAHELERQGLVERIKEMWEGRIR